MSDQWFNYCANIEYLDAIGERQPLVSFVVLSIVEALDLELQSRHLNAQQLLTHPKLTNSLHFAQLKACLPQPADNQSEVLLESWPVAQLSEVGSIEWLNCLSLQSIFCSIYIFDYSNCPFHVTYCFIITWNYSNLSQSTPPQLLHNSSSSP